MIRCVFRVDGSSHIGMGHLRRCTALADALKSKGAETLFICRDVGTDLFADIRQRGHSVVLLPQSKNPTWEQDAHDTLAALSSIATQFDWLIVDHYEIGKKWESTVASKCFKSVLVIDDLANREHQCTVLLDQGRNSAAASDYKALVPAKTEFLLGPKYALIRPEFIELRKQAKPRTGGVKKIFISFGGGNDSGQTLLCLNALQASDAQSASIVIFTNQHTQHINQIAALSKKLPHCTIETDPSTIGHHILNSDLGIGASGSMCFERCVLHLPSIVYPIVDNQLTLASTLACSGAALCLESHETLTMSALTKAINFLTNSQSELAELSLKAGQLVDGTGAKLVADRLI